MKKISFKQRVLVVAASFFLIIGLSLIGLWGYIVYRVDDKIYPHTFIDGVDLGMKTKSEALEIIKKKNDFYQNATIEVIYKTDKIATFSGEQLKIARNADEKIKQAYEIGRSVDFSSRIAQQINSLLHFKDFKFSTSLKFDQQFIDDFLNLSADTYNIPSRNALFNFQNGKVITFKSHQDGLAIEQDKFKKDAASAIQVINKDNTKIEVMLSDKVVNPEITLSEANNLGIEELIGTGTSNYSHSIASRIHNVLLAASKFNGIIVQKGEEFSFNKIIGDISLNTGYQSAYVIQNGRTVLGDGGGVCQVSTTIFRAALNTGLPITARSAHAYRVSYYENGSEPGFDATIFSPSVDLKFRNDTSGPILIQTEIDQANKILTFNFYGKKDGRIVEISSSKIWDVVPPPEPLYEDDPSLPSGQVKQIDYAAWGSKANFTYKVTSADGKILEDRNFYSAYRPWRAIFLRGTGA